MTSGFRLPARFVIHTVGPVWRGGGQGESELLASCYRNSLALARANALNSIAFPAISCGVYGYPIDQAAAIAVRAVAGFPDVKLVAFGAELYAALRRAAHERGE